MTEQREENLGPAMRGRFLTSRGPVIRTLVITNAIAATCAVIALILSLSVLSDRIENIQQARERAGQDTCNILRVLVLEASSQQHRLREGESFLAATGLSDCHAYGLTVRNGK